MDKIFIPPCLVAIHLFQPFYPTKNIYFQKTPAPSIHIFILQTLCLHSVQTVRNSVNGWVEIESLIVILPCPFALRPLSGLDDRNQESKYT